VELLSDSEITQLIGEDQVHLVNHVLRDENDGVTVLLIDLAWGATNPAERVWSRVTIDQTSGTDVTVTFSGIGRRLTEAIALGYYTCQIEDIRPLDASLSIVEWVVRTAFDAWLLDGLSDQIHQFNRRA
jgi:hypothetical protein